MKHLYLLLTFTLSLTVCKATVDVTMFPSPIEVVGNTSFGNPVSYSLDFENNGIPDLKFEVQFYVTGHEARVYGVNDQDIEPEYINSNGPNTIAYNCGAELGNGSWGPGSTLASANQGSFYAGAGIKYLAFRKFDHTEVTFGSNDYYVYGWVKLEVSADGSTITIHGFGIGTIDIIETSAPNVDAGEGNCDVSVQEHALPADVVTVLGNMVQVKTEEPVSIELFDLSGKLLFTERKNGANSIFQLPVTNSLVLLRVTAGIRSRTVKVKL
jgi:hypothetical protein